MHSLQSLCLRQCKWHPEFYLDIVKVVLRSCPALNCFDISCPRDVFYAYRINTGEKEPHTMQLKLTIQAMFHPQIGIFSSFLINTCSQFTDIYVSIPLNDRFRSVMYPVLLCASWPRLRRLTLEQAWFPLKALEFRKFNRAHILTNFIKRHPLLEVLSMSPIDFDQCTYCLYSLKLTPLPPALQAVSFLDEAFREGSPTSLNHIIHSDSISEMQHIRCKIESRTLLDLRLMRNLKTCSVKLHYKLAVDFLEQISTSITHLNILIYNEENEELRHAKDCLDRMFPSCIRAIKRLKQLQILKCSAFDEPYSDAIRWMVQELRVLRNLEFIDLGIKSHVISLKSVTSKVPYSFIKRDLVRVKLDDNKWGGFL
ncbi:hypothetical protein M422DRAFT_38645 [Sphaerobolus stellatus SS14]|uniref:Uncharacterized protein n=1 Tax=Sphaerobolus stellatus (strain SS14) TaxID=990650 RepID=A0A0C9UJI1_SPHS4|nr:hypothetical protein M422DRAFT_38645 [Sphaerobolus stellatus SS14]